MTDLNAARRSALVASFSDVTSDRRFGIKGPVVDIRGHCTELGDFNDLVGDFIEGGTRVVA